MPASITTARRTDLIPGVAQRILMDDAVQILPWDDVPLQNLLPSDGIDNIKPQWLNEDLDKQTGTVNATSAAASTTIVLVDSTNIRVNDVLKLRGGTVMAHVTANVYATGTLTVVRPFNGSTDQGLVATDILEVVGQNLTEGQDPQDPRDTDFTGDFNVTQIFEEACQATRTARKNTQYGTTDPYAHQVEKKYRELNVRLERAYIHSRRLQSGATRQMGGLYWYLTNTITALAKATLFDRTSNAAGNFYQALQNAYDLGAKPNLLVCSPAMKRYISTLTDGTVFEQHDDTGLGRIKTMFHTDFGDVQVEMDRQIPRQDGFVLQREYVERKSFDAWQLVPLAKTGDTDKGMIVGEFSLGVKNPAAHTVIRATDL